MARKTLWKNSRSQPVTVALKSDRINYYLTNIMIASGGGVCRAL